MRMAALAVLLMICADVVAQNVQPIKISGQPLVYMKAGRIDACGLRLIGIHVGGDLSILTVDASFNLDSERRGIVKVATAEGTAQAVKANTMTRFRVAEAWIKAPGKRATQPYENKTFPGEDGTSLLYVTTWDQVLELFKAALDGSVLNIGVKRADDGHTRIYSGAVALSPEEIQQVSACFTEIVEAMK